MNRHHYSLFVHNCRLVFLLRQEAGNSADLNVFKPAEWRFKVPEVCDGQWHHFALSVDFPAVSFFSFRHHLQINPVNATGAPSYCAH